MPKFFVCSDIHGFYEEFREALFNAGFDRDNKEHWLIVCGDCFDRGPAAPELMKYLIGLKRKILIRGNHEDLLEICLKNKTYYMHDYQNGTVETIKQFAPNHRNNFPLACDITENLVRDYLNSCVDYFETEGFIFVHSWIPLIKEDSYPKYWTREREFSFNPDWRNASKEEWEDARWGNPFELAQKFLPPDKIIVFGHWHTSWAREDKNDFSAFVGDGFIGLDGCVPLSHKVNIMIIEDDFLSEEK